MSNSDYRVHVLGAGVIGLTTALTLVEKGFKVHLTTETLSPNTCSDWSGARIKPSEGTEPKNKVSEWSKSSIKKLFELMESCEDTGITPVLTKEWFTEKQPDPGWKGHVKLFTRSSQEQISKVKGAVDGWSFYSGVIHPTKFLNWLLKRFLYFGGTLSIEKVTSLDTVRKTKNYDVIINCTGLGSRFLSNDSHTCPQKGQLVVIWAPWIKDCYYLLRKEDEEHPCYIIPRGKFNPKLKQTFQTKIIGDGTVVLGGTREMNHWDTLVDWSVSEEIFSRCQNVWPNVINGAQVIGHTVGLRPYRNSVRVEIEPQQDPSQIPLIHNYGQGASGMTICWGCAQETSDLIDLIRKKNITTTSKL